MIYSIGLIGVFDLMHEGHINLLRKASLLAQNVWVGVVCDEAVKKTKGENRPVFNEKHRLALVENSKYVYYAQIINDFDISLLKTQSCSSDWGGDGEKYLEAYIRGEDQDHVKGFDILESKGIFVINLGRTKGVSTTQIVEKLNATNK